MMASCALDLGDLAGAGHQYALGLAEAARAATLAARPSRWPDRIPTRAAKHAATPPASTTRMWRAPVHDL